MPAANDVSNDNKSSSSVKETVSKLFAALTSFSFKGDLVELERGVNLPINSELLSELGPPSVESTSDVLLNLETKNCQLCLCQKFNQCLNKSPKCVSQSSIFFKLLKMDCHFFYYLVKIHVTFLCYDCF